MINHRIVTFLESNSALHQEHHGFRVGRGTNTYFNHLRNFLNAVEQDDTHCEILSLDITKAYDQVWRSKILEAIFDAKLGQRVFQFASSFLSERKFCVSISGQLSEARTLQNGVPQGSVVSATFFILIMNQTSTLPIPGAFLIGYADDLIIARKGSKTNVLRHKLQNDLQTLHEWAKGVGLKISIDKTKVMHYCKRKRHFHRDYQTQITLDNEIITRVRTLRILGVFLDRRGTFNRHLEETKKALKSRLNLLRAISKFVSRNTLLRIGDAVVLSQMFYGIELYSMGNFNSLESNYNDYLRISSGAFRTSGIMALAVENGKMDFQHASTCHIVSITCNLLQKTSNNDVISIASLPEIRNTHAQQLRRRAPPIETTETPNFDLYHSANTKFQQLTGQVLPQVSKMLWVGQRPWNIQQVHIDWSIKNQLKAGLNKQQAQSVFLKTIEEKYQDHYLIFTDGSLVGEEVGIGVVSKNFSIARKLPSQCSIFTAEAAALVVAVEKSHGKTLIITDSASCLQALEKGNNKHAFIQVVENESREKHISFIWVPSHSGIRGNEQADVIANNGRKSPLWNIPIPASDVVRWTKKLVMSNQQQLWIQRPLYGLRKVKLTIDPWIDRPDRKEQVLLTRCRIGHSRLTQKHLVERNCSNLCDACNTELTIDHIFTSCRKFEMLRRQTGIVGDLPSILANTREKERKVIMFLKKTKLFEEL